jgi:hypothetical protein
MEKATKTGRQTSSDLGRDTKRSLERITEALTGPHSSDQRRIAETGIRWIETLLKKNSDYGSSAWEPPVLKPDCSVADAILVRMGDKIERIKNLSCYATPPVVDETLEDTICDLGGYCLLYMARPVDANRGAEHGALTGPAAEVIMDDICPYCFEECPELNHYGYCSVACAEKAYDRAAAACSVPPRLKNFHNRKEAPEKAPLSNWDGEPICSSYLDELVDRWQTP